MNHPHLEISPTGQATLLMAHDYDYRGLIEWLETRAPPARMAAQVIASMSRELRTIDKKLAEPEIELRVELPSPPTEMPVPQTIIRSLRRWRQFLADPMEFAAKQQAVTVDEYRRWVVSDGWPHCGATGIDGKRCRNVTSGGMPTGVREFLRLDGKPCRDHGGKPWQVVPDTDDLSSYAVPTNPQKEKLMTPHDMNEEQIALVKQYTGDVEGLVAAASEVSSPLHDLFDWSSTDLAATDARRVVAEQLLASVAVPPADAETGEATTETEGAPASGESTGDDENTDGADSGDDLKSPLNEAKRGE